MIRLVLRRLLGAALVIFFVASFGFLALRLAPGSPLEGEVQFAPEVRRNMEKAFGLDRPLGEQYLNYMGNLVQGDLGPSMKRPVRVNEIVAENFPRSLQLGLLALGFAALMGMGLGIVAASRQNSLADHTAMSLSLIGISIPAFVVAPVLIMWFSFKLGWLPPARWEGFRSMILPALSLGLVYMGTIARLTRAGMLETIRQDYVRTARAKGLDERRVILRHALRLGVMPVVTYLGPAAAFLITGSFVVEKFFQVPGLSFYLIDSVVTRDYTMLTGIMVFYCLFVVLMNLVVDIVHGMLDPRIREAR